MDILFLRDFRLELIIGVYEWERKVPQPVRLDLEIGLANSRAGDTDNVADTIDYGAVAMRVKDFLHNAPQPITLVRSVFAENVAAGSIPSHLENEIVTRDGRRRLLRWNNTILRDPDGLAVGTASIGEDITDRRPTT